jgi:ABC-type cobalamin/Fe3+-siderophores transport system ATPase subunit
MLEAKNISIAIKGRLLLGNVSARFEAGKVNVILGPNGAGKSTLLACLSGLQRADSGSAEYNGESVAAMDARTRARDIGFLPQSAQVHWDISVRELVALGRYAYRGQTSKAQDEAAIAAAMETTHIAQYARRNILSLSGGERARVLLARVLAGEPEWLLADEPLANLDPRYQMQLLGLLRQRAQGGAGVVTILHDLTQAARVADHIILLHEGQIFASGSPAQVMTAENLADVYGIECTIIGGEQGQIIIVPNG